MPARGTAAGRKADFPGTGRAPEKGLWPGGLRTAVEYVYSRGRWRRGRQIRPWGPEGSPQCLKAPMNSAWCRQPCTRSAHQSRTPEPHTRAVHKHAPAPGAPRPAGWPSPRENRHPRRSPTHHLPYSHHVFPGIRRVEKRRKPHLSNRARKHGEIMAFFSNLGF